MHWNKTNKEFTILIEKVFSFFCFFFFSGFLALQYSAVFACSGDKTVAVWEKYRKIPKINPRGLYFSKVLFEGIIFWGAYIWKGLSTERNLHFKID